MLRHEKVIISCAVTGASTFNRAHPDFPIRPDQIAAACIEAAAAGAAIVHVHVRDPETGKGTRDPRMFKQVVDRVRDSRVDVLINLTGGLGATFIPDPAYEGRALPESDVASVDERMEHLELCLPDIASLDITTANQLEDGLEHVYLNTTPTMRAMARRFQACGIKPELEVFGAGDIVFGKAMIDEGLIDDPPMFQFVLGVKWGAPADVPGIQYMRSLLPPRSVWGALGIGREEFPVVAQTAILGGNVRVGLEDNLYLKRGVFATNGQLVERAAAIIDQLGYERATPSDARAILAIRAR